MKKPITVVCLFLLSQVSFGQVNSKLTSNAEDVFYTSENKLSFIRFKESAGVRQSEVTAFINANVFNKEENRAAVLKTETDQLGFTHIKYNVFQNGIVLANKIIMAHCKNGRLVSLNGDLYDMASASNGFNLTEAQALNFALNKIKAQKYKWENREEEQQMRVALNDPSFTYYPHATRVVFEKEGKSYSAYQFNIYAEKPLYRANVFVDASNGAVLDEQSLICTADVPGSALTKYSGTQTITCDFTGTHHRLREVQRGQGVETYNMNNTTVYSMAASADFTNTTANWTNTGFDQAATDAHWGAEQTYDYYMTQHNRNSIDNNGFKLLSFVHFDNSFTNAFWDGQRMTYGDGDNTSVKIFTALDVCGHEITHGLTSNTGNLIYSNESGALNESYSDIFGTAIENFARPTNWNWKIGEDITFGVNNALRSMSNPGAFGNPDTYGGANYYTGTADNGGVHTNSGVSNFWFYLLTTGGSGTNDISNSYTVTGIGMNSAAEIAFRALTFYFIPSTNYANARILTIQAAKDLFGTCSNEVIQTTRAWYAVGVGANYITGVIGPNFTSGNTSFCSPPATVSFSNTSINGLTYTWDFGDGATATTTNAVHSYTAVGAYSVKLKATGCSNLLDSITKTSYIVINPPVPSPVTSNTTGCMNQAAVLNATGGGIVKWYYNMSGGVEIGNGNTFVTPFLNSNTTFYVANTLTTTPVFGGRPTNANGGYTSNNTQYLVFDVLFTGVLNSVVMYAQTANVRDIELRDAANNVINSISVNLSVGANTVALNFPLDPGTGYRLGLAPTSPAGLYRSTSQNTFPYNVGNCVKINTSSTGTGAYYFFYNWKVTQEGCASPRVPAQVVVNALPVVSFTADSAPMCAGDQIALQGSPAGGTFSGNGVSGAVFNSAGLTAGSYNVIYTYTDNNSCSSSMGAAMKVQECTGIATTALADNAIVIYPNPAKDKFILKSDLENVSVVITDATGRLMLDKQVIAGEEFALTTFSNGLYIVSVKDTTGKTIKTLKLIRE